MTLLQNILKNGTLFQEMRKSSVVPDEVIDSRLYKESTVNTQIKMENTINKAYYYCECAMAKIDDTIEMQRDLLFREAKINPDIEGGYTLYFKSIERIARTKWTTIVNLYKAFIAAINSVRAFFVSQKGVLRKLDKVVEILKANAKKKPKVGAKVSVPLLIKTDAKDKNAIVANLIKSINALFVLSEGSVYASAELHRSSGKVIVADFNKYITEVGSLDPLKSLANGVKELTKAAPSADTIEQYVTKLAGLKTGGNNKNVSVVDSLLMAPVTMIAALAPIGDSISRKDMTSQALAKFITRDAKQIQSGLAKKPISTVILDSFTGEVSDKSLLPRLRANTVQFVADEGYLNMPELTKGLESAKEQIKRLFVGKKENLASLLGAVIKHSTKLMSQTKKGSNSADKVAKKAGNTDNVADKKGVDELVAASKMFTAACNLLLKDYTRTVAECKIGINTLLNGTAKLVGKTISKEDGTGFEEDFDPEEDAKEGFKKEPTAVNKPDYMPNRKGAIGSTTVGGLKAGHQRTGTGSKTANFPEIDEDDFSSPSVNKPGYATVRKGAKGSTAVSGLGAGKMRMGTGSKTANIVDSKGRVKDVISQVEEEHISAKELNKRQAAQRKGARR